MAPKSFWSPILKITIAQNIFKISKNRCQIMVLNIFHLKVNPSRFHRNTLSYSYFEFCANLTRGKSLPGFVNKLFISVKLIVFLDHNLPLVELAQEFKIAAWWSVSMKQNFKGFTFKMKMLRVVMAPFLGNLSQSEKFSEIKPPLANISQNMIF